MTPSQTRFAFKPTATDQSLKATRECLAGAPDDSTGRIEGVFSLKADIGGTLSGTRSTPPKGAELSRALNGNLEFRAREGRLYGLGVMGEILTKIIGVLNITQIFVGSLPDLAQEGMRFEEITAKAKLIKGRLEVSELIVGATAMKLFSEGDLDLRTKQLDFTVVASPLRTVDRFITKLPIFKQLLPHGLVGIPIKVSGTIDTPSVVPLSPTAVGSRLLALTQRTLMLPVSLIQSILPENTAPDAKISP